MEIPGKTEAVAPCLQRSNCLLKCLFVGLTNTHYLSHSPHLCAQFILGPFKFFKAPASKLDYYVFAPWGVLIQSAFPPIRNLVQSQTARKHGRYKGNGKTCGL